jgi:tripartite-type tricarboxylate transporter receptor subunit TctC
MRAVATLAIAAVLAVQPALAQTYPAKPIRIVAPYPPGGIDVYARQLAPKMSELLGQPIVIDNRGGANGLPGTEHVAKSAADGYTLLWAVASTMVAAHFLMKNVPFDTVKDFTPIAPVLDTRHALAIYSTSPVKSIRELIDFAKKNPGKLSYGSTGVGSTVHLEGEALKMLAGLDILHVPYKGTGPMMVDSMAGRFDITVNGLVFVRPLVEKGTLRALAVMEPQRNKDMPDIPALGEIVAGWRKPPNWAAFFGPAGMPRPVVDRLHATVQKVVAMPEIRSFIDKDADIVITSPDRFAAQIREDIEWEARMVKALNIQPE